MKRNTSIDQVLKPLGDRQYQAYLSNVLQVADILEWILEQRRARSSGEDKTPD